MSWVYSGVGLLTGILYFITHGQVHGNNFCTGFLQCRTATASEIWREDAVTLYVLSSIALQLFVYPALYGIFDLAPETRAA